MTASRRLRVSSSARTASASPRRIPATVSEPAARGSIGVAGFSIATRPIRSACARSKSGRPSTQWKRRR